jgi:hypothetical protein
VDKQGIGFLTIAENTATVDYLRLAYLQALNIKATQKIKNYSVIVDRATNQLITDQHRRVFDNIIVLPVNNNASDSQWKLANETQVFALTPYRETIKLESDLLFTSDISHWLPAFRLRDVMISTGCRTYRGELATDRSYRKFFDDNDLPDVYTGLMYFRYTRTAADLYRTAEEIRLHWPDVAAVLKNCRESLPSTDVLFAIAAQVIGPELVTASSLDFINFAHMKPAINNFEEGEPWWKSNLVERDGDMFRINLVNQYWPIHYHDKSFATDELIEYYERRI